MKTVLTVAGADSSGGAGISADIKTMTAHGVYAMNVFTALTAQNTLGVRSIFEVTPEFLKEQLDAVYEDIFPNAVKIGMVSSSKLINVIADRLQYYKATNIVVDPVMVTTSGNSLIKTDSVRTLAEKLFPIASLITPNIPEAEVLAEIDICDENDMCRAAEYIGRTYKCAVLVKGGHNINDANDLLYSDGDFIWFYGQRINNPNTHGTGCTLSSAIASNLAKGCTLTEAVTRSKKYVSGALACMMNLGRGTGPLNHLFDLHSDFFK